MSTYIDIQLKGKGFSPRKLKSITKLPIEILVESGEIARMGRYKGKPSPYGIGIIKVDSLNDDKLMLYGAVLLNNKAALKQTNVEEIIFDIDSSSKDLDNWLIGSKFINLIASLNAKVQFHKNDDEKEFHYLIDALNFRIASSRIQKKERIIDLLKHLSTNEALSDKDLNVQRTYGLIMYLLQNLNKSDQEEVEPFDESLIGFTEIQ